MATTRLKEKYKAEAVPALQQKFGYKNPMEVPKLEKIVINIGLGNAKDNAKKFETAVKELGQIAGQKPLIIKAKRSVANFKLREGMNVGTKVTLRGNRMNEFADKLINIALPRVRDLALKEQLIFPEVNYDDVDEIRGMEVVFVTTAKTDEECKELLKALGLPFAQ